MEPAETEFEMIAFGSVILDVNLNVVGPMDDINYVLRPTLLSRVFVIIPSQASRL